MRSAGTLRRVLAPTRLQQAAEAADLGGGREVQRAALAAEPPEVGGMVGVTAHAGDLASARFDDHASAHAAIWASGTGAGYTEAYGSWEHVGFSTE